MDTRSTCRLTQPVKGSVPTNYNGRITTAIRRPRLLTTPSALPGRARKSHSGYSNIRPLQQLSISRTPEPRSVKVGYAADALPSLHAAGSAAGAAVGEQLIRKWLGISSDTELDLRQEIGPLRETSCDLSVTAAAVTAEGRKHVLLAFVITDADPGSSSSSRPGNAGFSVSDLRSPVLHWGSVWKKGDRWQPPPAGWSTWPDVSNDARGGAWQTPFAEQNLPNIGPALTLLVQLPCDGPLDGGGLSFLVKTGSNQWLGNAATYSDFFFPTGGINPIAAEAVVAAAAAADDGSLLLGPDTRIDLKRLGSTPVQTEASKKRPKTNGKQRSNGWQQQHHHEQQQQQHRPQEPELPNAGRREKEPAHDETQVCTLTAAELHAAAAAQLATWITQQTDLELPPAAALDISQHEFPVKGHPNTPFVVASTALWQKQGVLSPNATPGSSSSSREAVLLLAAVGDVGLTGTRAPGLVMHWSGVADEKVAVKNDSVKTEDVTQALPEGWSTLPDLSWDAGAGFWDTPMTRHLFRTPAAAAAAAAGVSKGPLARPASPSFARVMGSDPRKPADMYLMLMRLPLKDAFCTGGLLFALRTARRAWISHAKTSGPFFISTAQHAHKLGISPPPQQPPGSSSSGMAAAAAAADHMGPDWNATHDALVAAGLSEADIDAYAAGMPNAGPGLDRSAAAGPAASAADPAAAAARSSSGEKPIRSADAELADYISQHSMLNDSAAAAVDFIPVQLDYNAAKRRQSGVPNAAADGQFSILDLGTKHSSSSSTIPSSSASSSAMKSSLPVLGSTSSKDPAAGGSSGEKSDVVKFLRSFEPEPVNLDHAQWGLLGTATSDYLDIDGLAPHDDLVSRIGQLEHKARRSLMHRYGIAADLVTELLPDIQAAAAAPHSLAWPPSQVPEENTHTAAKGRAALSGLIAVAVWLRLSALRLLTWNHNYNVKPREISAALDRLGASLIQVYDAAPQLSGVVLLALSSAGRGGEGDMGQRIRDEILAIQHRNHCKGGMMEEWHQKLHNNSSPDDLAICQALLDYLASGQQQHVYWDSLAKEGIDAARLASFDRPIRSPPPVFSEQQVPGLVEDLTAYRRTLAAVHSGADLSAAVDGVMGYDAGECKGKRVKVEPLAPVATPQLKLLLSALLVMVQGSSSSPGSSRAATPEQSGVSKVSAMLDMERCVKLQALVMSARASLAPHIRAGNDACRGRLSDVLFLDLALELTGRNALDSALSAIKSAAPSTLLGGLLSLLQQPVAAAAFSALPGQGGNAALVAVCRQLRKLSHDCPGLDATAKARHALSLIERLRSLLAAASASATAVLQPTAAALAAALGIEGRESHLGPVALLSEEIVRGSAAASLSLLLTAVEPSLRRLAGVSAWSIISRQPPTVTGTLSPLTPCLSQLTQEDLNRFNTVPTILVLQRLAGDEEVPSGVTGVIILGDSPDVLSHAAVRARNCKIPVVACPSSESGQVAQLVALAGKTVQLSITGDDVQVTEAQPDLAAAAAAQNAGSDSAAAGSSSVLQYKDPWSKDSWILTADQFTQDTVGAKAMSAARLAAAAATAASSSSSAALPSWLHVPPSVALPHGVFEALLLAAENGGITDQLRDLSARVAAAAASGAAVGSLEGDLERIRHLVHQLQPPKTLEQQLKQHLTQLAAASGSSTISDHSDHSSSLSNVWPAIRSVWASQWNSRAVAALSKAHLPLDHLRMGVLLQPLLPARYSWVAHTVNPATGSPSEVSVQLVVGLGEVLVGNHPGRALGGIIQRNSLTAALQQDLRSSSSGVDAPIPDESMLLRNVNVVSYPSKNAAVVPGGMLLPCSVSAAAGSSSSGDGVVFMARSDSNAEDLSGFAGAGLFDSVPTRPTTTHLLDYTQDPLVWDHTAAAAALWRCALAAVAAEQALQQQEGGLGHDSRHLGTDVEGCITADGRIWLLQARPQV